MNFRKRRTARRLSDHFAKATDEMEQKREASEAEIVGRSPMGGNEDLSARPPLHMVSMNKDGEVSSRGGG